MVCLTHYMVDLIPSDIDYCKRKAMRNSEKDVSHSPKHVSFVSGLFKQYIVCVATGGGLLNVFFDTSLF